FATTSKLQAYAGADPAIYQSGNYVATNTPMVKRGSSYLRHALYPVTCMASFSNNIFAEYIAKKKAQGKHHYVAMAHGMKKMIRVIFRILKSGKDYEEPKK
ncbi:MAG: transposase, partial [Clostridia bacterium]|nr:transposase [Clostridia bacterium]